MQTKRDRPIDVTRLMVEGSAVDEALRRAGREALLRDKRLGLAVPIWRNGRTEWVPPDEIDTLLKQSESPA